MSDPVRLTQLIRFYRTDFFLSSIISLFFLRLSGSRPDLDRNTVSKGRKVQNNQPTNQTILCIIAEHKMKTKNGGKFHPLPYTKLTLYLHWLQKFTLSDNDYESIDDKNRTLRKTK